MSPFLGRHQNRLDAKGRVSVPAPFRDILRDDAGSMALILLPSIGLPCIEAWTVAAFLERTARLETLDPFGAEYEELAMALHGEAFAAEPDKEGRVMLPDRLASHAGLREGVLFIGTGKGFQIWEPVAGVARLDTVREKRRVAAASGAA